MKAPTVDTMTLTERQIIVEMIARAVLTFALRNDARPEPLAAAAGRDDHKGGICEHEQAIT